MKCEVVCFVRIPQGITLFNPIYFMIYNLKLGKLKLQNNKGYMKNISILLQYVNICTTGHSLMNFPIPASKSCLLGGRASIDINGHGYT